ncbi:MAG TPA: hypothetical protein VFR75_09800 [Solirubrobacterales bacterium]|nr:hypothetical protein [Solirubrobacterales bacterium]
MIPLGHIGGLPVEELAPVLAGGGASLLAARAWLSLHLKRRPREPQR